MRERRSALVVKREMVGSDGFFEIDRVRRLICRVNSFDRSARFLRVLGAEIEPPERFDGLLALDGERRLVSRGTSWMVSPCLISILASVTFSRSFCVGGEAISVPLY
jgi:hypothetical protein